jgi:hypothetical protein
MHRRRLQQQLPRASSIIGRTQLLKGRGFSRADRGRISVLIRENPWLPYPTRRLRNACKMTALLIEKLTIAPSAISCAISELR